MSTPGSPHPTVPVPQTDRVPPGAPRKSDLKKSRSLDSVPKRELLPAFHAASGDVGAVGSSQILTVAPVAPDSPVTPVTPVTATVTTSPGNVGNDTVLVPPGTPEKCSSERPGSDSGLHLGKNLTSAFDQVVTIV